MESPKRCVKEGERERERRRNKRGGGGGVWTLTGYGTYRHPDCALLSSFLEVRTKEKRGNRKKGPGSECRDGPPTPPPLVGVVWTRKGEGKAAEQSTLDWGFLPQQRDCHKTAFQSSRGLVLLRFQVCI